MSLQLKPAKGSLKNRKRIGRGNASGQGRTAGKGHNGYKARSGTKAKLHFEGGQTPLMRRLPTRGMKIFSKNHRYKNLYQTINLSDLAAFKVKKIDFDFLYGKGLLNKKDIPYKVLSNGELSKALEISAHSFSKRAIEKIESAGGKAIFI